jgi:putative ABC transport system permease protein
MRDLWQDTRFGLRLLRRQPAFAGLAILTLALGIGAATTIFSFVQNVLFDPFPGHTVERVVAFQIRDAASTRPGGRQNFELREFLDYQAQLRCFEEVIAGATEDVLYTGPEQTESFMSGLVTPNNFRFLGMGAALGRTLRDEDARADAPPVFLLTHKTWVAHFGADPAAVGRSFTLNGVPTTLVGVMPPNFAKLGADLYRPVALDPADRALQGRFFLFQGRLAPGVTLAQAKAEITVVAQRLATTYPKLYPPKFTVEVVPLLDSVIGPFRKTLYTLSAAVALLLLIACSNVSNLLLTRAAAREKEMAVRTSLGANRARLVRQLLVEALLLALAAAALGCVFAYVGIQALVAAIPEFVIPRQTIIRLNVPALLFSLAAAVASAVLTGLVPALQAARHDVAERLKDGGKGASGGARRHRWSSALVVGEVGLSLVLLAGAGLLMRSFVNLQTVDLGLEPEGLWIGRLSLPRGQYKTPAETLAFYREAASRIRAVPGVTAASITSSVPIFGGSRSEVDIPGQTHEARWDAIVHLVDHSYADVLGLRLQRGRYLSEDDVAGARRVAVVNEAFVRKYLGGEDPLGRTIRLLALSTVPQPPLADPSFEVVGVTVDAKNAGVQDPALPEAAIPSTVTSGYTRGIIVRAAGAPAAVEEEVKREIRAVDARVALTQQIRLTDALQRFAYAQPQLVLVILAVFATVGLVLVAVGVFGVIAYTVSRQAHDIGVRMALGARRSDVLRLVLLYGLKLVGAGVAAGLLASLALTRVLASQLFGVAPHDPVTLVAVIAVVGVAGLFACSVPALRASRVDPMVALRLD